ncbi:hypothetical protein Tco_1524713 [Tanacetum coccineum]
MDTNVTIERLTNEANVLVNDCLFLLSKDEEKMSAFVEKLKLLKDEVKADVPNPPSRNTGDVIGGIFSISKHNQIDVQNPTKAVNIGEHLKREERLKSEREKALKVRAKAMKFRCVHVPPSSSLLQRLSTSFDKDQLYQTQWLNPAASLHAHLPRVAISSWKT